MMEQELIQNAVTGDRGAFGRLVEVYQRAVFNLCYRMMGEAAEAEDAAQETFLRAYSQLGRYDPGRPFKTWLFAIACHHCIDRLRKRRFIWCDIDDEPLLGHPALRERTPGPEEQAIGHEHSAAIQALLGRLAPKDRATIVMRYWYDASYDEIAAATGATVSSVKSRLHRAREVLGGMVDQAGSGRLAADRAAVRPVRPGQVAASLAC